MISLLTNGDARQEYGNDYRCRDLYTSSVFGIIDEYEGEEASPGLS